jgi:hypothetical protein
LRSFRSPSTNYKHLTDFRVAVGDDDVWPPTAQLSFDLPLRKTPLPPPALVSLA